ncbi:MAG TPA: AbrB/MazE/SpoVT family DNA-binding domain-containing protein [Thermoanaerobaculia bacterium]|nr:AbrB/MazE/SpoVT family DNA-binding domain-containing protein [Thermoanaerobaculia bacterium]
MTNIVGEKGQVVIEKPIREALGILPGSTAVQELRDDHVEIRFYPPEHRRSLRGVLAGRIGGSVPAGTWGRQREAAWRRSLGERVDPERSSE